MPSKNSRGPGFQGLGLTELVRAKGLEPPHLAILEPKSSASTSSATPAARRIPAGASLRNRDAPLVGRAGKGKTHGCPNRLTERMVVAGRSSGKDKGPLR